MACNGICLGVGCGFCGWVGLFKVTGPFGCFVYKCG